MKRGPVRDLIENARAIASKAHSGQTRADGVTPYIQHPNRVASLVRYWGRLLCGLSDDEIEIVTAAALLHDVIEDTPVTLQDLSARGMPAIVVKIVDLLTKPDASPARAEYYARIATDKYALLVKAADTRSNIEDAIDEVLHGRDIPRWRNYLEKRGRDVLPLYSGAEWTPIRDTLELHLDGLRRALEQHCGMLVHDGSVL